MPADKEIIAHLNIALKNKLTSINQYFLHARMLKHAGNVKLADHEYKASIDAMKYSDMLVEHILSLGGAPNLQELGTLMIGNTPADMLSNDLALTEIASLHVKTSIAFCESRGNTGTAALLKKILESQTEHTDFIRKQLTSTDMKPSHMKDCA